MTIQSHTAQMAQRAIHRAHMAIIQRYMARMNSRGTQGPMSMRRPTGYDYTVNAAAKDARNQVAQKHRVHNRAQARTAARMGGQGRTAAQQGREQARQAARGVGRGR